MKPYVNRNPLINQYGFFLLGLNKTPKWFKQRLLKYGDDDFIKCVCECCDNVLKGNVCMSNSHKALLSPSSKNIRQLADKSISIKKKRKLISLELLDLITKSVEQIIRKK